MVPGGRLQLHETAKAPSFSLELVSKLSKAVADRLAQMRMAVVMLVFFCKH